jgi:hypothetical protein
MAPQLTAITLKKRNNMPNIYINFVYDCIKTLKKIQALPPTSSRKYLQGKNDIKYVDATFFPSIPASSYMPDFQKYIRQQHSKSQDMDGTSIDSNFTQKMQQHAKHLHKFCL